MPAAASPDTIQATETLDTIPVPSSDVILPSSSGLMPANNEPSSIDQKEADTHQDTTEEEQCIAAKPKQLKNEKANSSSDKQEHDKQKAQKTSASKRHQQQPSSEEQKVNLK